MKITVVIVTKNRQRLLARCLASLQKQTHLPDEVIIVDNNSTDTTALYIQTLQGRSRFPLRRVLEKKKGYPVIYNRGIKESKYPWVIFIDDDCVASPSWLQHAYIAIHAHPTACAIVGESTTLHTHNVYSLAMWFTIYHWKYRARKEERILDMETLDNKNIAYNKRFLKNHHLSYDESRSFWGYGAAEDADLGMQLWQKGGKAFFAHHMRVAHQDPTTFGGFFRKIRSSIASMVAYEDKWGMIRAHHLPTTIKPRFIPTFFLFWKTYHLSYLFLFPTFLLLCITFLFNRFYGRYMQDQYQLYRRKGSRAATNIVE
jgi:glycosyltransferase involved in cell wall biosynthesis